MLNGAFGFSAIPDGSFEDAIRNGLILEGAIRHRA
jgi:hypothetical protein